MPRPTTAQLRKINKFSQIELKEDQVYVFRSLSADTLPVMQWGWFGQYSINLTEKMLQMLKKDYQNGVGLLASHNKNRLPFGRTFDAEVKVDEVDGESVKTLYIDHYIVTHMQGENGERRELNTEIGMTTQEIADHIEVGHTFDTSIGFSISDPKCSICKNSIRDYDNCEHIPGLTYTVDGEKVRCDIIADSGEGIENSLVYAGAVDRAIIQRATLSKDNTENSDTIQASVKLGDMQLYTVNDIKNLPKSAELLCFLTKGNMQLFTTTPERRDFMKFQKGREEMPEVNDNVQTTRVEENFAQVADVILKSEHEAEIAKKDEELQAALGKIADLEVQLKAEQEKIEQLTAKAELADQFTEDLIQETIKAGIAARGNAFNVDRFERYLRNLSVDEIKEEFSAMREEFSGSIQAAVQATETNVSTERDEGVVEMSESELRQEAAKIAYQRYKSEGGNLEALTKAVLAELKAKSK